MDPSRCEGELLAAARAFRLGMDARGNEALARGADLLAAVLAEEGDGACHALAPRIADALAAQERGDGLRVADVLEFELLPRLRALRSGGMPA